MVTVGVSLLLVGGTMVGFVAAASAASPGINVSPHAHLTAGEHVSVRGTGFIHGANGAILECNDAPGQPATGVAVHGVTHLIAVGCTDPVPASTSNLGRLASRSVTVQTGTLGSWEPGPDTSGNAAATDSAGYPCPPTTVQENLGVSCVIEFLDNSDQVALHDISFKSHGVPTTTTTTSTTTTTTTIVGCDPAPQSATGGAATMTVNPGTCLAGGSVVTISGSGFTAKTLGSILECNDDDAQPTVSVLASAIPVGCSSPTSHLVTTDATGALAPTSFTIVSGTVGPPATGTDSTGGDAATDAASYPCPPTPAEVAVGVTCDIEFGDEANDAVTVPISFRS
ncbi:MAG TPA: hypothetical protein VN799_09105 [Acidimicrobiales bacterium]|nr:hypothetical protein [Acidimicrobiales bacterium]